MDILESAGTHGISYSLFSVGLVLLLSGIGLAKFEKIQAKTGTRTWIAGLVLMLVGVGGILIGEFGIPYKAQKVGWAPDRGGPPGIDIREPKTDFIPWKVVEQEVTARVFNQVEQISPGSTARVNSLRGKPNRIVEVVDPSGVVIGNIWFGKNPRNNAYTWDGLIRVGIPKELRNDGLPVVWETFRREQDGSYVKIKE